MRTLVIAFCFISLALAQSKSPSDNTTPIVAESPQLRDARHSFMLVSTRAVALFQSAASIEARLQADGSTLHPSTTALRLRIERTLDQIEDALKKQDVPRANDRLKVAEELVNRFERRIGAE